MAKKLSGSKAIEALAVKRAKIADADKVRYRVYRAPDDFVAVIAESALMAMKVSGISNPHRIVRDLPHEHAAVEAQRIARDEKELPFTLSIEPQKKTSAAFLSTELAHVGQQKPDFVAMQAKDFQKKNTLPWARVLTPEMVEQAQAKAKMAAPVPAPASAPVSIEPAAPPVAEVVPPPAATEAAPSPMPVPEPAATPAAAAPQDSDVLSPEEVERLLNG